jgi:hypothetical protein
VRSESCSLYAHTRIRFPTKKVLILNTQFPYIGGSGLKKVKLILPLAFLMLALLPLPSVGKTQDGESSFFGLNCDSYIAYYGSAYFEQPHPNPADDVDPRLYLTHYIMGYVSAFNRHVWNGVTGIQKTASVREIADAAAAWCLKHDLKPHLTDSLDAVFFDICEKDYGLSLFECQGIGEDEFDKRVIARILSQRFSRNRAKNESGQSTASCLHQNEVLPQILHEYAVGVMKRAGECDRRFGGRNVAAFNQVLRKYGKTLDEWAETLNGVAKRRGMTRDQYFRQIEDAVDNLGVTNPNMFSRENCSQLPKELEEFNQTWANFLREPIAIYFTANQYYQICD